MKILVHYVIPMQAHINGSGRVRRVMGTRSAAEGKPAHRGGRSKGLKEMRTSTGGEVKHRHSRCFDLGFVGYADYIGAMK